MNVYVRSTLAAALCMGGFVGLAAPVMAQANCQAYALESAKQQKENEDKSCGFSGPEWSKDIKAHLAWCESQEPDVWIATLQSRREKLNGCK